jgi:hypothetical protein
MATRDMKNYLKTHDPLTGANLKYFAMVGDYRTQTPTDLGIHDTHEQAQAAIGAHALAGHSVAHPAIREVWVDRDGFFRDPPQR